MSQKFRLREARIKSEFNDRSGLVTENMTSATPDRLVGSAFKNVLVNENGEFIVGNEVVEIEYYDSSDITYNGGYVHDRHRIDTIQAISNASTGWSNILGMDNLTVTIPFDLQNGPLTAPFAAPSGYEWYLKVIYTSNCYVARPNGLHQVVIGIGWNHDSRTGGFCVGSLNHNFNFISETKLSERIIDPNIYFTYRKTSDTAPFQTDDINNVSMNANRVKITYVLKKAS